MPKCLVRLSEITDSPYQQYDMKDAKAMAPWADSLMIVFPAGSCVFFIISSMSHDTLFHI